MGRERQKKKRKSSIPKARPKRKPQRTNPKDNPLIAANWDHRLTLSQNYRRLGLTAKLGAATGGTEKVSNIPDSNNRIHDLSQDPLAVKPHSSRASVPSEVRVEHDPDTGAILRIADPDWKKARNPLDDPLNDVLDAEPETNAPRRTEQADQIVRRLEEQASVGIKKKARHQSRREVEWMETIAAKYGVECEDYDRIARDVKINPNQRSAGDIRRRMRRWRDGK